MDLHAGGYYNIGMLFGLLLISSCNDQMVISEVDAEYRIVPNRACGKSNQELCRPSKYLGFVVDNFDGNLNDLYNSAQIDLCMALDDSLRYSRCEMNYFNRSIVTNKDNVDWGDIFVTFLWEENAPEVFQYFDWSKDAREKLSFSCSLNKLYSIDSLNYSVVREDLEWKFITL